MITLIQYIEVNISFSVSYKVKCEFRSFPESHFPKCHYLNLPQVDDDDDDDDDDDNNNNSNNNLYSNIPPSSW